LEELRGTVIVVEDDSAQSLILSRWLEDAGHEVVTFEDGESCLRGLAATLPDAVCLDLRLPGMDGLETLDRIRAHHPRLPVVMLTVDDALEPVVAAIRLGAFEYLRKPLDRRKLLTTIRNAVGQYRMTVRLAQLEHEVGGWDYPSIQGRSEPMRALFRQMDLVAPTDVTVLIQGESGTGKELVANALHDSSGRKDGPFIAVNCAAIAESLQESELFGHERGAFTGATKQRPGRFEQANRGTIFLDEIAELTPALQAQLLRVLQEQRFFRVGGTAEVRSDFRLIAATHRDLPAEVVAGRFREDLYFRLAVLELSIPPLRERGDDIRILAETFARNLGLDTNNRPASVTPAAMATLMAYFWPGNVRELRNAIQRAVVLAEDARIGPDALPEQVRRASASPPSPGSRGGETAGGSVPAGVTLDSWADALPDLTLEEVERHVIRSTLARHEGNLSAVARALDISRTTLYRKMAAYGIGRASPD
jgi:DNA-binding NtrC family response regulator